MSWRARTIESLEEVTAADWNQLQGPIDGWRYPFTTHEFLCALETTGCVGADLGWQPRHLMLQDDNGALRAAAPLYLKDNSYGEFVFDFSWAQAYRQAGLSYYPKLVCCVPYSPVTGPRLLAANDTARSALYQAMLELPAQLQVSSLHLLFAHADDYNLAGQAGAALRRGCQYQWFNRDYASFDDLLTVLSSKRRKEIRRERRKVAEAGIHVELRQPDEIDEALWQTLYLFYSRTYLVRGQRPYLTLEFFKKIGHSLSGQVLFFVAYRGTEPVAMAFMLRDHNTLYGRHWGCLEDYDSLHFETCYYAGIDYCIHHGLARFDAGAQGEHKIRRGFEPIASYSAHTLLHNGLQAAVEDFVGREAAMIADYHADLRSHCAFPQAEERHL